MKQTEKITIGKQKKKITSFTISRIILEQFNQKIGYASRSKKVEELIIDFLKENVEGKN